MKIRIPTLIMIITSILLLFSAILSYTSRPIYPTWARPGITFTYIYEKFTHITIPNLSELGIIIPLRNESIIMNFSVIKVKNGIVEVQITSSTGIETSLTINLNKVPKSGEEAWYVPPTALSEFAKVLVNEWSKDLKKRGLEVTNTKSEIIPGGRVHFDNLTLPKALVTRLEFQGSTSIGNNYVGLYEAVYDSALGIRARGLFYYYEASSMNKPVIEYREEFKLIQTNAPLGTQVTKSLVLEEILLIASSILFAMAGILFQIRRT